MPAEFQEELSLADRQLIGFIERGQVSRAYRPANTAEPQGDYNLPSRVLAGEELLRGLDLPPTVLAQTGDEVRSSIILLRNKKASRLTLVFNGNTVSFALPRPLIAVPDTHIMLIRDPNRSFGFAGIPDLGPDYPTCLANLRRLIEAIDVEEVYVIGMSAGGSSAMRFGVDLSVKGILGFSVPTTLDLNDDPGAELRHYPELTGLYRRARHYGIDLAKYYDRQEIRPGLILVYSEGHLRDQWLAERMTGVFGTELVRMESYVGHKTFRWLQGTGTLEPLLDRLFKLAPLQKPASPTRMDDGGPESKVGLAPNAGTRIPQPDTAR